MPASAVVKNCYRYSTYKKTSYSEWYFSNVDVCQFLTDSTNGRKYWNKLKQRLKSEENETVTNCHQLKNAPGTANTRGTSSRMIRKP